METSPLLWVFAIMTLIGVVYFLITILTGSDVLGTVDLPGFERWRWFRLHYTGGFLGGIWVYRPDGVAVWLGPGR
ncbi:MAG: hypothetical protein R3E39_27255 [Anaerolineae bacterium]